MTAGQRAMRDAGAAAPAYWEQRAQRFAGRGEGLQAVCSYGMPLFYNRAIHVTQRLALARWLEVAPGTRVLDVGCGVGRWSRALAHRGALVTGVDLSPTMLSEARRRADQEGLGDRCRFQEADLAKLSLGHPFDLILGVTVLQHIMDSSRLQEAVRRLAGHLAPQGRMVLMEAAPTRATSRCDTAIFNARTSDEYLSLFACAGLRCEAVGGCDPAPFKLMLLPYYRRLPAPVGLLALGLATAASLPVDLLAGRILVESSWHKVFVLRREAIS